MERLMRLWRWNVLQEWFEKRQCDCIYCESSLSAATVPYYSGSYKILRTTFQAYGHWEFDTQKKKKRRRFLVEDSIEP